MHYNSLFSRYLHFFQDVLQAYLKVTYQEILHLFVLLRHSSTSTPQCIIIIIIILTKVICPNFTNTLAPLANTSENFVINPLALELDIYSLAHHLCKMLIF